MTDLMLEEHVDIQSNLSIIAIARMRMFIQSIMILILIMYDLFRMLISLLSLLYFGIVCNYTCYFYNSLRIMIHMFFKHSLISFEEMLDDFPEQ